MPRGSHDFWRLAVPQGDRFALARKDCTSAPEGTAIPTGTATAKPLQKGRQKQEGVVTRFHHILVPVDFEECSQEALDVGIDLAVTFDAKLTLIHAWDVPSVVYATATYVTADLWTAIEQAANEQLQSVLARVRRQMPSAEALIAKGSPAVEIIAGVDRAKADLVVMGTHGRRGVGHVILGSVAERVVRLSPVPVVTIRGKKREQAGREADLR